MSDQLDEIAEKVVTIKGAKYIVQEASGAAVCHYRQALLNATQPDMDGKPTKFGSMLEVEIGLLADCLCKEQDREPVTREFAATLPYRKIKGLITWIKQNSDLESKKGDDAANPQMSSEPTSTAAG